MEGKKTPRKFSDDFRREAVRQVTERGRPVIEVAGELAIHKILLRRWMAYYQGEFVDNRPKFCGNNLLGRPKGIPNKTTIIFKDALLRVYAAVGGDKAFAKWAKDPKNHKDFYLGLMSRLIPRQMEGMEGAITIDIHADDYRIARAQEQARTLLSKTETE